MTDPATGDDLHRSPSTPTVRFGRHPENEVVLRHGSISRLHLTLTKDGERFFAEDSSKNGSFVQVGENWVRIHGRTELKLPATIRLAGLPARVDYESDAQWDQSVIMPAGSLVKRTEAIFVFDLCESSRIASENDVMAYHLKQRLMQLADPVLAEHGARFVKGTGDGFLATFPEAGQALAAALEIESRIQHRNSRTNNPPIHYRIALHSGETWGISTGGQDIHGNDVNITFRIEGVQAEAFSAPRVDFPRFDRILCSEALVAAVRGANLPDALPQATEIGAASLKGITEPVRIHWLRTG